MQPMFLIANNILSSQNKIHIVSIHLEHFYNVILKIHVVSIHLELFYNVILMRTYIQNVVEKKKKE